MLPGVIGAIVGLIGTGVNAGVGIYNKKLDLEAKRLDQSHELSLLDKHIAARGAEMEHEASTALLKASGEAMVASYKHDESYGPVGPYAATALRLFRPILTLALIVLVWYFYREGDIDAVYLDGSAMTGKSYIVFTVCESLTAALTWWFGDHGRSRISRKATQK